MPSLARRLTVIAYEDIGLANPEAQIHTVTALDAAQKIGFPEALHSFIANGVIDLALSPSNVQLSLCGLDKAPADLKHWSFTYSAPPAMATTGGKRKELGECAKLSLSAQLSLETGSAGPSARKIKDQHYFLPEDTGRNTNGL